MPSTRKKVLIRSRGRPLLRGYLDPVDFREGGDLRFLSLDGQVVRLPAADVKGVYFVGSFEVGERLGERKGGGSRPRLQGLWVRVRLHDHEVIEGVLANNLLELDGAGLTLAPASVAADYQRVYVPREAIAEALVLGVIGGQRGKQRTRPAASASEGQGELFSRPAASSEDETRSVPAALGPVADDPR
ncbi:MAG TPA: hypothetical protein VE996_00115 [Terriglobales bacterium]|nr:hypothetical protein [Terriglobales bacterium]